MYKIVGINLVHRAPEDIHDEALTECTVIIDQGNQTREIAVELNAADLKQIGNLLRQKVDQTLNGE